MYDRETIKHFINNYHKLNIEYVTPTIEDDKGFFDLDKDIDQPLQNIENIDDIAVLNEMDAYIQQVATDKEYFIFMLRCQGKTFKEIGKVFGVTSMAVNKRYNDLIDRVCE